MFSMSASTSDSAPTSASVSLWATCRASPQGPLSAQLSLAFCCERAAFYIFFGCSSKRRPFLCFTPSAVWRPVFLSPLLCGLPERHLSWVKYFWFNFAACKRPTTPQFRMFCSAGEEGGGWCGAVRCCLWSVFRRLWALVVFAVSHFGKQ